MSKKEVKANWLDRTLMVSSNHYMLCTTEKQYKKALKHLRIPKDQWSPFINNWHSNATAHHFENRGEGTVSTVICIANYKDKTIEQIHALLVHEAVHIWLEIKQNYGETNPSSEFEAYSIQNLSQSLMEEFKRQTS